MPAAISRSEFQRRHLTEYRAFLNSEAGEALLGIIDAEHPIRLVRTPPSSEGHSLCQGYETLASTLRNLRDFDHRNPEPDPQEEEISEEHLATSASPYLDENA